MTGDSVREELAQSITITPKEIHTSERRIEPAVHNPSKKIVLNPPPNPIDTQAKIKAATAEISSKKTNRTLVEFQSKDGTVPEWRTRLKNAVRQRELQRTPEEDVNVPAAAAKVEDPEPEFFANNEILEESNEAPSSDRLLSSALDRIEASRKKFYVLDGGGNAGSTAVADVKTPVSEFPAVDAEIDAEQKESTNFPKAEAFSPHVDLYDTSELDPDFVPARVSSSFGRSTAAAAPALEKTQDIVVETPAKESEEKQTAEVQEIVVEIKETEEAIAADVYFDDRAQFAFRFNAGLFDMITASFASLILLAPFMLLGGSWLTLTGVFAFVATVAIVSFIYLTTTIGLFGKSFGMHLFSLEMIDGEGEEYPTFHQAAVSSSVYLLSLIFFGAGFLTCLVDEENRAIHDIVSRTLIVREQ